MTLLESLTILLAALALDKTIGHGHHDTQEYLFSFTTYSGEFPDYLSTDFDRRASVYIGTHRDGLLSQGLCSAGVGVRRPEGRGVHPSPWNPLFLKQGQRFSLHLQQAFDGRPPRS